MKEMLSSRPALRIGDKKTDETTIGFAVAASALKHIVEDDFSRIAGEETEALASRDAPGMLRRR